MEDDITKPAKAELQHVVTPFVSVDAASERPKTVDPNAEDVGGVADQSTHIPAQVAEDDDPAGKEDGLPGDGSAIYQRGATIIPPG